MDELRTYCYLHRGRDSKQQQTVGMQIDPSPVVSLSPASLQSRCLELRDVHESDVTFGCLFAADSALVISSSVNVYSE